MADRKRLIIFIGGALVLVLLIVGITLAIVLPKKKADPDPEPEPKDTRKKLIIDHDGGADDAFAITMALLYEKYFNGPKVVALTTVFGTVTTDQALFNSDRIRTLCDRQDIPIYDGAFVPLISGIISDHYFGNDGLGDTGYRPPSVTTDGVPAASALIELSKKYYDDELIIVATGPLTNIALAARADPFFIRRLHRLYVGAGHIQSDTFPSPEFNAAMDPEAYYIVAEESVLKKSDTFIPLSQVHNSLNLTVDWRVKTLGGIQTKIMEALNDFEHKSFTKSPSWAHLGPATMAIALNEDLVDEYRYTTNSVELEGVNRGFTTTNFSPVNANARTLYTANIEKYKKFLLDVYSEEPVTTDATPLSTTSPSTRQP